MRASILAVACCACNEVYGIEKTGLHDAPPPDAPFECPPLGAEPVFSRFLHQIPLRGCSHYTVSLTGRAVAVCDPDGPGMATSFVGEGPIDADLRPVLMTTGAERYMNPRISPDGERLYVQHYTGGVLQQELFTRQGETFSRTSIAALPNGLLSTIATDPGGGDRVLLSNTSGSSYDEMLQSGGVWTQVMTHTPVELGLGTRVIMYPTLSADGLRLLFTAQREVGVYEYVLWYSDRAAVGTAFRTARQLEGVPYTAGLSVMTETCARVYISGLDRTFYVQQR